MNTIILVILILELTLFFMFSSYVKIIGWPRKKYNAQFAFFKKCGLNQKALMIVGVIELFGAAVLWLPNYLGLIGVLALCSISAAVVYGYIRFDSWKNGLLAMALFVLSSWVLYVKCVAILA